MHDPHRFDALDTAVRAAAMVISLAMRASAPLRPVADQLIHSASSVPANLAEGAGRSGRDRAHLWRIAYGSAKEADTHLRLLVDTGAVDRRRADISLGLFDDFRAMTWRLLYPAP